MARHISLKRAGPAPKYSPPGAISPLDPRFDAAVDKATAAIEALVAEFEAATGRRCSGVSLCWTDATRLHDTEPMAIRQAAIAWLPMEGEFE